MFRMLEIIEIATVKPANVPNEISVTFEYELCNIAERKIVVIQATQQVHITSNVKKVVFGFRRSYYSRALSLNG